MDNRIPSDSYAQVIDSLIQGPRLKTLASYHLETICKAFLNKATLILCQFNSLNELEISINGEIYNLTSILKNNYDFSHLVFSEEEKFAYASFITNECITMPPHKQDPDEPKNTPFLTSIPSAYDYDALDPEGEHDHLHYAEKLAITIYTTRSYALINNFLRQFGQSDELKYDYLLKSKVKEILLAAAMATSGLTSPPFTPDIMDSDDEEIDENDISEPETGTNAKPTKKPVKPPKPISTQILHRKEYTHAGINTLRDLMFAQKKAIKDQAFTSTSALDGEYELEENTEQTLIEYEHTGQATNIAKLSIYGYEKELLFPPGMESVIYKKELPEEGQIKYSAVPVRPAPSADDDIPVYSPATDRIRSELLSIVEMHSIELLDSFSDDDLYNLKQLLQSTKIENEKTIDADATQFIDSFITRRKLNAKTVLFVQHAQYVYDNFLSKPYKDSAICSEDLDVKINGTTVYRPNHGLAHTLRMTFVYLHGVINYLINHAKDSSIKTAGELISSIDKYNIQIALLFTIIGRESEVSFVENADKQSLYKKISAQQYRIYAKKLNVPDVEIDMYAAIIEHLGNPPFLLDNPSIDAKYKFALIAMNLAHRLDLARCYTPEEYAHALEKTYDVVTRSTQQQTDLLQLIKLATKSISNSGDRLMTDISGHTNPTQPLLTALTPSEKTYHLRFAHASQEPKRFMLECNKLAALYAPTFGNVGNGRITDEKLKDFLFLFVKLLSSNIVYFILIEMHKRKMDLKTILNTKTENNTLLHYAVKNNNLVLAQQLLNYGANPNISYKKAITPLHIAAKRNNTAIIQLLIEAGADLDAKQDGQAGGFTPAHIAIQEGYEIKQLLEHGANPNAVANDGLSLMHLAILLSNIKVADDLMEFTCDLHQKDKHGISPIEFIKITFRTKPDAMAGFENYIYFDAKALKTIEMLDVLKDENLLNALFDYNINDIFYQRDKSDLKLILENCLIEISILKALVKKGVNTTPTLHNSIRTKDITKLNLLLHAGADPTQQVDEWVEGMNALHIAIKSQYLPAIEALLNKFPELISSPTKQGMLPIHLATLIANEDIIKLLLKYKADINAQEKKEGQQTPLHTALTIGRPQLANNLLKLGADINAKDGYDTTPIILATEEKNLEAIKILLTYNPDLTLKNKEGNDVIDIILNAIKNGNPEYIPLLMPFIEYDASILNKLNPIKDNNLLHNIFKKWIHYLIAKDVISLNTENYSQYKKIISTFIKLGININAKNSMGTTILFSLNGESSILLFKLLLEMGADPTILTQGGRNMLHSISETDPVMTLEVLKTYPALAQHYDDGGCTPFSNTSPLYYAITKNWLAAHPDVVFALLEIDTNLNAKFHGKTCLELAITNNHLELVEKLLNKDANLLLPSSKEDETIIEMATKYYPHIFDSNIIAEHFIKLVDHVDEENSALLLFIALRTENSTAIEKIMQKFYQEKNAAQDLIAKKSLSYKSLMSAFFVVAIKTKQDLFLTQLLDTKFQKDILKQANHQGMRAINFACANGHLPSVKTLLTYHLDDNDEDKFSILSDAIIGGNIEILRLLLEANYKLNTKNHSGISAWYYLLGIHTECNEVINFLFKNGINFNDECRPGMFLLHLAIKEKNVNLVRALLANGANPNLLDTKDESPVFLAISHNQAETALSLLQNGANPSTKEEFTLIFDYTLLTDNFELLIHLLLSIPDAHSLTLQQINFLKKNVSELTAHIINLLKALPTPTEKIKLFKKLINSSLNQTLTDQMNAPRSSAASNLFSQPKRNTSNIQEILDVFPELVEITQKTNSM